MASVEQRPVAVESQRRREDRGPCCSTRAPTIRPDFDEATRRVLLATIEFFESRGKATLKEHDHERTWYADFLEFVAARAHLRDAADARGRRRRRPGQALGHRAQLRVQRDPRLLRAAYWYTWQVTILGLGPIWQSDNAAARAPRGRAARGRRDLRVRPLRARARRRHLLDRHGPHARRRRRLPRERRQVLHRQRQRGRAWCRCSAAAPTSRARTATSSSPPTASTRPTSWSRTSCNAQMYVSEFELEDYPVRAEDVLHTGARRFDAALNTVNVGKFNLGFALDRDLRARASTRRSPTPTTASSTASGSPSSRTCARSSPTPTRGWSR